MRLRKRTEMNSVLLVENIGVKRNVRIMMSTNSKKINRNTEALQNINNFQNQEPFQVPEILRGKTFLDPTYDSSDRKSVV